MKLRRFGLAVLLIFVGGLVCATAGEVLHSSTKADQVGRSESPFCPDPGNDGGPCAATCPCACCPGHLRVTASATVQPSTNALLPDELDASSPDDLNPKNIVSRIFHPPRA